MSTIQGTDGDTTGALITNATTATELTALIQPASHTDPGAETAAQFDKLAALGVGTIANAETADAPTDAAVFTAALNAATATLKGLLSTPHFAFLPRAAAATLTDAPVTITPLTDKRALYVLPAGTLSANRTLTVDNAEGVDRDFLFFAILDTSANTYRIQNQDTTELYTKAASPGAGMLVQLIKLSGAWSYFARYWIG